VTSPAILVRPRNGPAVAHYPAGATLGPRVLPCFEFVWMLAGRAVRYDEADPAGTREHALAPDLLLLARPTTRERYAWDPDRPCVHAYVTFYVDRPGPLGDPDHWPALRRMSADDPLAGLCRYLVWLGGTAAPDGRDRVGQALAWLLDLFVTGPLPEDERAALPGYAARLADHLRVAWSDGRARPVPLTELAGAAAASPGHLARLFRHGYGLGPVAAVELIRLARAAVLLQRSNLTVGAISDACGFANAFHFSRRFRTAYGLAPRDYRLAGSPDPLDPVRRAGLLPLARRLVEEP
jgi:AraC-like DNA-binding protein